MSKPLTSKLYFLVSPLQLRRVTPLGIALDFFNIDTEPPADHAAVFIPFTNIIDIAALPD